MPTKAEKTPWGFHANFYIRALKGHHADSLQVQLLDDEEVTSTERVASRMPKATRPTKVSNIQFYGGSFASSTKHSILPMPQTRCKVQHFFEDIQSDVPTFLWAPWEFLSVSSKGQSGSPVCDSLGNVIGVMSEGSEISMHEQFVASGTSMAFLLFVDAFVHHLASKPQRLPTRKQGETPDYRDSAGSTFLKFILDRTASFDCQSVSQNWVRWRVQMNRSDAAASLSDSPSKNHNISWIRDPEQVLERLVRQDTQPDERATAVLFAETAAFSESHRDRLLAALAAFISEHRFTGDEETITIVGSAIRKYAMNMGESDFDAYSKWMLPTPTQKVHHEIELELVKGACWRLQYVAVRSRAEFPNLRKCLVDLATDYLSPRLILDKNYASIALFAIVAVVLLDGVAYQRETSANLLHRVAAMDLKWFSELVADRMEEAIESVIRHDSEMGSRIRLNVGTLR